MTKRDFLDAAVAAATLAKHPFPEYAACEAALESGFGLSELAEEDNNLFGMKAHKHPEFGTVYLPTEEFTHGAWTSVDAGFVRYPDWPTCFFDRVLTLQRLAAAKNKNGYYSFPGYRAAMAATDGETFVREVSTHWATDPLRAQHVLDIHAQYFPKVKA